MAKVHSDVGVIAHTAPLAPRNLSARFFNVSAIALVATVWLSALLFGLYILAFYANALLEGEMARWNMVLPGLYDPERPAATAGIGLHFATGGIILVLGCIQLLGRVRDRFPAFHRWVGRVYVASALLAGVGGLVFIVAKGTIGGVVMDLGFGLYGVLMVIAAIETYRHIRAGRREKHRAWAIRLFALAIGSWLYRMDYGFWMILTRGLGHTRYFNGPFDMVMAFFFYLPNLAVAEAFIRGRRVTVAPALKVAAGTIFIIASLFLFIGTAYFTYFYWGPAILSWIGV